MSAFWKAFPNRYLIRIEGGKMALPFEMAFFLDILSVMKTRSWRN